MLSRSRWLAVVLVVTFLVMFALVAEFVDTPSACADPACDAGADEVFTNDIVMRGSDPAILTTISETCTGTCDIDLPDGDGEVVLTTLVQTLTNKTLTSPDINAGTVDAITSLTVANNVDIGPYDLRAATLTADGLTSGRVVFATTNGQLTDDADMTFAVDTFTVTKLGAFESTGNIDVANNDLENVGDGGTNFTSTDTSLAFPPEITADAQGTMLTNPQGTGLGIYGGQVTITDDNTATIQTAGINGLTLILSMANGGGGTSAIIQGSSTGVPACNIMSQAGAKTVDCTTADVTGTTGADGNFTVSIRTNAVEFENRIGGGIGVGWFIIGQ